MDNSLFIIILASVTTLSVVIVILSYINISAMKTRLEQMQVQLDSKINRA